MKLNMGIKLAKKILRAKARAMRAANLATRRILITRALTRSNKISKEICH